MHPPPPSRQREPHTSFRGEVQRTTGERERQGEREGEKEGEGGEREKGREKGRKRERESEGGEKRKEMRGEREAYVVCLGRRNAYVHTKESHEQQA